MNAIIRVNTGNRQVAAQEATVEEMWDGYVPTDRF